MSHQISTFIRQGEDRRAGSADAREATGLGSAAVTVHLASSRDARDLDRLAQLDSARAPVGPTLVAEVDGELVAALPVRGGRPLADPFRPTADLVGLLEMRAAQLLRDGKPRRRVSGLLRRWRPAPAR
jgi:hypothetical protein